MYAGKYRDPEGTLVTVEQLAKDSNLGLSTVLKLAKESGALVKIGRLNRVDPVIFYEYIRGQNES